jgi:hypothetical protein
VRSGPRAFPRSASCRPEFIADDFQVHYDMLLAGPTRVGGGHLAHGRRLIPTIIVWRTVRAYNDSSGSKVDGQRIRKTAYITGPDHDRRLALVQILRPSLGGVEAVGNCTEQLPVKSSR